VKIRIGNTPHSWRNFEIDAGFNTPDYQQVLNEMREAGYEGTELGVWGFMPTDPAKLKGQLQERGLELISAFVPIRFRDRKFWETGLFTALQTATFLSAVSRGKSVVALSDEIGSNSVRTQNAGRIIPEMGLLPIQWKTFSDGVEFVSRRVFEETGLESVFRHHCAGFVETSGEIGMFLDYADPRWVNLCLDTGHFRFAGSDPQRIFKNFSDRVKLVRFKDCSPQVADQSRCQGWDYHESLRNGVFCELGQGDVNFLAVVSSLAEINYEGWVVVEQDILPGMGSPKESAIRNREYLRTLSL
jgi:inosose dehydratase